MPLQTSGWARRRARRRPCRCRRRCRPGCRRGGRRPTPLLRAGAPPTLKPSSTSPSQSLSSPSQILGGDGAAAGLPQAFGGEALVDRAVAVVVHAVAGLDGAVLGRPSPACCRGRSGLFGAATGHMFDTPSSIRPLQLSSLPLQTSAGGTVLAMMPTIAVLAALVSVSDTRMACRRCRRRPRSVRRRLSSVWCAVGDDVDLDPRTCVAGRQAWATGWNVVVVAAAGAESVGGSKVVLLSARSLVAGLGAVGDQDDDVLSAGPLGSVGLTRLSKYSRA